MPVSSPRPSTSDARRWPTRWVGLGAALVLVLVACLIWALPQLLGLAPSNPAQPIPAAPSAAMAMSPAVNRLRAADEAATPAALSAQLNTAAQLADAGQIDQAKQQLMELARRWPHRPEPHINLAVLASRAHDAAEARQHLEAALRCQPAFAQALSLMTRLNGELAQQAYARALTPERPPAVAPSLPWVTSVTSVTAAADGSLGAPEASQAPATGLNPANPGSPAMPPLTLPPPDPHPDTAPRTGELPGDRPSPARVLTTGLQAQPESVTDTGFNRGPLQSAAALARRTGWVGWSALLALLIAASAGGAWASTRLRAVPGVLAAVMGQSRGVSVDTPQAAPARTSEGSALPSGASGRATVPASIDLNDIPVITHEVAVAEAPANRTATAADANGAKGANGAAAVWETDPIPVAAPEARLLDIYRLIGAAQLPQALREAERLVHDWPSFSLAQLVYGDLLLAQTGSLVEMGQGAVINTRQTRDASSLRQEATQRLRALTEQPPAGTLPKQVLQLAPSVHHLVAVDASRSRLYVLENHLNGPRVIASHYVSIGSLGIGKRHEGDQRTPLGLYHITARLDGHQLGDFYGAGALPLNYPNELDRRLGRTGANIWLHGTPSGQYARAPLATNGCIVLSNDDLTRWLRELAPRQTPVIVADHLEWVGTKSLATERQTALGLAESWRRARLLSDDKPLMALYSQRFDNGDQGLDAWREQLRREARATQGRDRQLDDLSALAWHQDGDTLLITFSETLRGSSRGMARQQYWSRESGQWKIFSEGVVE
ncbi:MAG: L,D-transpeptidase family protein [Leptothrix sp. (in: b-proteobacteria)]